MAVDSLRVCVSAADMGAGPGVEQKAQSYREDDTPPKKGQMRAVSEVRRAGGIQEYMG